MAVITEHAPAKINLFLHITGKREDGYHELQSLVAFAAIGDNLTFYPADELTLEITGPYGVCLSASQNLVLRTARRLQQATGSEQGAHIVLEKNLPIASGIGGGSSDAAATLRGLQTLWQRFLPHDDLYALALSLGADIPVCLNATPTLMEGVGERITPYPAWQGHSTTAGESSYSLLYRASIQVFFRALPQAISYARRK